jgi:hypothetical protein
VTTINAQTWSGTTPGNIYYNSGNIGIGTSIPNWKLHIKGALALEGDGAGNYVGLNLKNGDVSWHISGPRYGGDNNRLGIFWHDGNTYYDHFTIIPNGNVGIGLSNPSEKLVIDGNLKLNQPSGKIYWDWTSRVIEQHSADGGTSQMIRFRNSMGAGQSNPNGGFDFTDYQGNSILRINDFKVGIGTNQPETKLEVTGSGVDPNILKLSSSDVYTNSISMIFHPRGNFLPNPASSIKGILDYGMANQEAGSLSFNTSNSGQLSEKMRIRFDGNVGIGTTTPDSKLTVAGNIHSREVKVTINAGADFVFQEDYDLLTLNEVEQFIKQNKHLPDQTLNQPRAWKTKESSLEKWT